MNLDYVIPVLTAAAIAGPVGGVGYLAATQGVTSAVTFVASAFFATKIDFFRNSLCLEKLIFFEVAF